MNTFTDLAADLKAYFHAGPRSQAGTRLEDEFRLVLGPKTLDAIVAYMDQDEAIASTNRTRKQLRGVALELMMWEVYQRLREEEAAVKLSGGIFKAHVGFMQEQLAEFLESTHRR
jgi:hypothetical protein